ncbi:deoxyribonuclease V [candidate division CSSED10-310 bacterium]|uniref:Endonuclease V n=1 Tax=candidate division CSSED10-310 bacterium TaxID=2855610 RepID=A0ABV6Z1X4_UNCC1
MNWNLSASEAINIQQKLFREVELCPCAVESISIVCGCDVSYRTNNGQIIGQAAVINWEIRERVVLEQKLAVQEVVFPYIPGLLSFREIPPLLSALDALEETPHILLVDGQGIAHPRRFGLASHLGLVLQKPTIGCAKSKLIGTYNEPARQKGSMEPLFHKNEQIGTVVRSRDKKKPLFVSPGHLIDHGSAVAIILKTLGKYRLPEPLRLAHHFSRNRPAENSTR